MKEVIQTILKEIPKNTYFDTHAIINYLIQHFSDDYLAAFNSKPTELFHGDIGKEIKKQEGILIEKIQNAKSWSKNIHQNYSTCTLWKKL